MKIIRTECILPFSPSQVWDVLADFAHYSEWNPLNIRAEGEARLGAQVSMTFVNPAKPGARAEQVVTIICCDPGRSLRWRGKVPLLFEGTHFFDLYPCGQGTHLVHGEKLKGLVPLSFTNSKIETHFVPVYEAANRALEARVALLARRQERSPEPC